MLGDVKTQGANIVAMGGPFLVYVEGGSSL